MSRLLADDLHVAYAIWACVIVLFPILVILIRAIVERARERALILRRVDEIANGQQRRATVHGYQRLPANRYLGGK